MIPPKRFDISPPLAEGCSEGLDAFRFFFKNKFIDVILRDPRAEGRGVHVSVLPSYPFSSLSFLSVGRHRCPGIPISHPPLDPSIDEKTLNEEYAKFKDYNAISLIYL